MNISLRFTHILKKGRIYSSDLGFVCSLWLPNESGSVDPHIFANPDTDSGSPNVADPTDLDPEHCFYDLIYN